MAVAKSKKSKSKTKMKRAHNRVKSAVIAMDHNTGESHRRHHVTSGGFYKGKPIKVEQEQDS
ncbi:MAG TPA: 50S ribosomal protein L32 [Gammaproteobacteria bacterium]|nr:50S ribosomal protein L32 [Gammaproteobacteria bacterium]